MEGMETAANKSCWKVYVHVNKNNGKRYVGITSKMKPEHRWNHGRGYAENSHFCAAIEKYGWDHFYHLILFDGLTEKEAKDAERFFITAWHTKDPLFGYNMTDGGDGTPGFSPSALTRQKLSIARQKENLSPETLLRRSVGLRGRVFSDDHKRKIGDGNSKKVQMLSADGTILNVFPSARVAEETLGISHSHISQCCHHQRNTAGGYMWTFAQ